MSIDKSKVAKLRRVLLNWARKNLRDFPWRRTSDPFTILLAEMLLRRTTSTAVARVFPEIVNHYGSLYDLANADVNEIAEHLKTLGLQNTRARQLKEAASKIVKEHNGEIPSNHEALLNLPGVGRYIASAVMNFAFGVPMPMVDGNIVHFLRRVFGIDLRGMNDKLAWFLMSEIGGARQEKMLYWAIIDIVSQLCLRRKPRCGNCPIQNLCESADELMLDR